MGKRTSSSACSWSMPAGREGHSPAYAVLRHFLISAGALPCRFVRTLGEFEPIALRPEHPGVFEAYLAGIRTRLE